MCSRFYLPFILLKLFLALVSVDTQIPFRSNLTLVLMSDKRDAGVCSPGIMLCKEFGEFNEADLENVKIQVSSGNEVHEAEPLAFFLSHHSQVSVYYTFDGSDVSFHSFMIGRFKEQDNFVTEFYYTGRVIYENVEFPVHLAKYRTTIVKLPFHTTKTIFPLSRPQHATMTVKFLHPVSTHFWGFFGFSNTGVHISRLRIFDQHNEAFNKEDFEVANDGFGCAGGDILNNTKSQFLFCRYGLKLEFKYSGVVRQMKKIAIEAKKYPWYVFFADRVKLEITMEYESNSTIQTAKYSVYHLRTDPIVLDYE